MPQDVKLSPDGQVFYVSDMIANGVYIIDNKGENVLGFLPTGKNAHGLYVDRTSTRLFVTNRGEGTISIIDLASRTVSTKWDLGGGSPDMGNFSADGKIFWVSSRLPELRLRGECRQRQRHRAGPGWGADRTV